MLHRYDMRIRKVSKMNLTASCLICQQKDSVSVWPQDWNKYAGGANLQAVWPGMDPAKRDVIHGYATGAYLCVPCNDRGAEDEDE